MKTTLSVFLLALAVALPAMGQTVYRWVDSQGVVHYSDEPHQGAKEVQLGATTTVLDFKTPNLPGTSTQPAPAASAPSYQVAILAPAPGTTLRPPDYKVQASVRVKPPLAGSALLQYQLDGKKLGKPTARTSLLMHKVYRGTHTLTVTVVGPKGQAWGEGSSTFYVHHHSVLNPPGRHVSPRGGGGGGG